MPAIIRRDPAQYRKTVGNKSFYITVQQSAVDLHATVFNVRWGRLIFRITDMPGESVLDLLETGFRRGGHDGLLFPFDTYAAYWKSVQLLSEGFPAAGYWSHVRAGSE